MLLWCVSSYYYFVSIFPAITKKTRITDVVYNASSNELVRTKTLVKNCIVVIDATPFRQWYEAHYAMPLIKKKGAKLVNAQLIHILYNDIYLIMWPLRKKGSSVLEYRIFYRFISMLLDWGWRGAL